MRKVSYALDLFLGVKTLFSFSFPVYYSVYKHSSSLLILLSFHTFVCAFEKSIVQHEH